MRWTLCFLVLTSSALADDWVPPKNPQPQAILQAAKADKNAKRFEDALAKQVWIHEHSLDVDPAMTGVRLSFALSNWLELGEAYPPALAKMKLIRDTTEARIRDLETVRVRFEDFHDFVALNRTLRNEEKTARLFEWIELEREEDAKSLFQIATPALIKAKMYATCAKYMDPKESLTKANERFEQSMSMVKRFGKMFEEHTQNDYVNSIATLVAIMAINERKTEAAEIAEKAKQFIQDPSLSERLSDELESALEGVVPAPWP
jgi:hypothetical protein